MKNSNHSSCGGADALTSLLLPYRSLRICPVVAPRHRIRRAHNLNCRSCSTDSQAFSAKAETYCWGEPPFNVSAPLPWVLLLVLLMPAPPRVLVCTCELEPSVLVETLVLLPESLCVWQPQTSAVAANIANKVFIESNVLRLWRGPYRENCCPKRASDPSARPAASRPPASRRTRGDDVENMPRG